MRVALEINSVDFTPWIAEDGIKYSTVSRVERSVVTLGGTKHKKVIEKNQLDVTLMDLPDDELSAVTRALSEENPALVNFTDKNGLFRTGYRFYISGPNATAKLVIGNTTYFSGISFTMEEK